MIVAVEAAHQMGLLPAVWLASQRERRRVWWWLAGALAISWVADTVAHWVHPWLVSAVYPVSQAGLIAALLVPKKVAATFVAVLVWAGVISLQLGQRPEILLHTVAWLGLAVLVYRLPPSLLREALFLYFGLGWVAWLAYTLDPGWASWGTYQGVRALGLLWFCWAQRQPERRLA